MMYYTNIFFVISLNSALVLINAPVKVNPMATEYIEKGNLMEKRFVDQNPHPAMSCCYQNPPPAMSCCYQNPHPAMSCCYQNPSQKIYISTICNVRMMSE